MYALILAVKEWRHYLIGPFYIEVDHEQLEKFDKQPNLSSQQAQWQEVLQQYDMEIKWIPGSKNIVADSLLRRLDHKNNNILSYPEPVFLQKVHKVQENIPQ